MVYGLLDFQFWLFGLLFLLASFCSFYLPGSYVVSKFHLKSAVTHLLLSVVLGISLWGIQGYIFGYAHLRWLTYFYVLHAFLLFTTRFEDEKKIWFNIRKEFQRASKFVIGGIFFGALFQILAVVGSGLRYKNGVEFFFTNSVDGLLHLTYIQAFVREFPAHEPGAYDLLIINYHFWSDLVMAELVRIWHLPVSHLLFQYVPLLVSLLTGVATYLIVRIWKGTRMTGLWALFLLYLSGDAAYLFNLVLHRQFGFDSPAIDNGATQFLNIPQTFAKLVFIAGLIPLTFWIRTKKKSWLFFTIVLFSTLIGFKVYFGIFAGMGLSFLLLGQIARDFFAEKHTSLLMRCVKAFQKNLWTIFGMLLFGLITAAIYLPANKGAGGLIYSPLEWPRIFLGPAGINFQEWWLRKQVYDAAGNFRSSFILDVLAVLICLVCVFGTRLLGFYFSKNICKKISWELSSFFTPTMIIFTLLGLYTLQVSGLFNVYNFFVVAIVGLSLFSAFTLSQIQSKRSLFAKLFLCAFVLLTIPRALHDAGFYIIAYAKNQPDHLVDNQELAALYFIQDHTPAESIIQGHWNNESDRYSPYIPFFSNRYSYLSGERLLDTHNQPTAERKMAMKNIFSAPNSEALHDLAKEKNIQYIYLQKNEPHTAPLVQSIKNSTFIKIFENDETVVLQTVN
jgi:hypothetical protein